MTKLKQKLFEYFLRNNIRFKAIAPILQLGAGLDSEPVNRRKPLILAQNYLFVIELDPGSTNDQKAAIEFYNRFGLKVFFIKKNPSESEILRFQENISRHIRIVKKLKDYKQRYQNLRQRICRGNKNSRELK